MLDQPSPKDVARAARAPERLIGELGLTASSCLSFQPQLKTGARYDYFTNEPQGICAVFDGNVARLKAKLSGLSPEVYYPVADWVLVYPNRQAQMWSFQGHLAGQYVLYIEPNLKRIKIASMRSPTLDQSLGEKIRYRSFNLLFILIPISLALTILLGMVLAYLNYSRRVTALGVVFITLGTILEAGWWILLFLLRLSFGA